ncbi:hypothetical protein BC936DRAFT_137576, partial [Jimgerdemannia flammicorona]
QIRSEQRFPDLDIPSRVPRPQISNFQSPFLHDSTFHTMADSSEKKPLIEKDAGPKDGNKKGKPKPKPSEFPDYVRESDSISTTGKIVLSSVLVACLAAAFVLPYHKYRTLMGVGRVLEDVGLDNCQKFEGPAYCEEVHLDKRSGLAFLSCDPYRPIWNPVLGIENEGLLTSNGEIWVQDLNKKTPPQRIPFSNYNESFHPLGLTVAPAKSTDKGDSLTLLVVNQPNSEASTVEIFTYTLSSSILTHLETLTTPLWTNLDRIAAENLHWGMTPVGGYPIPSFYLTQHHVYPPKDTVMRTAEDTLFLPIGKVFFYNAIANEARPTIWRLNNPSGIKADIDFDDGNTLFVTSAVGGLLERYISSVLSRTHQFEYKLNPHTGKIDQIYWPGMVVKDTIEWNVVPQGIDIAYFPAGPTAPLIEADRVVFATVQADYFAYKAYARALETAYKEDPADPEARVSVKVPPTVVYRSFQERVLPNGEVVTPEMEEDEDFNPKFVMSRFVIRTLLADAKGKLVRGATGVVVDAERGAVVIVGAYEKGSVVCAL